MTPRDWQIAEAALHEHDAEYGFDPDAIAALARLREREAQLEQGKTDQLRITQNVNELLVQAKRERNAAEARVEELERSLHFARLDQEDTTHWKDRAERAEAEVQRFKAALEMLRDGRSEDGSRMKVSWWAQEVIDAALDKADS